MRLISLFFDVGQMQRFKYGAESIISGAIGGVSSLAGSIMSADQSDTNVRRQLQAQLEENAKNRDWQTAEAEKNRMFQQSQFEQSLKQQTSEREASQAYQSGQWQNQFNQELLHRFDVPKGVNPAVYFSSHGAASGVGGSVSAPSASAPSSPSGSMPSGSLGLSPVGFQPFQLQVPQLMDALGGMMSGLANAKKAGVETKFLEDSLADRLRKAMAEADLAQLQVALSELDRKLQESTLPDRIKKAAADYKEVLSRIDLLGEQRLTEQEEQSLKRSTASLNDAIADYNRSSKQKLDLEIQYLPRFIESQILANRGSAAAGFGAASESEERTKGIKFENELNQAERQSLSSQIRANANNAIKEGKISDTKVKLFNELTRKFELENDWYIANQILNRIQDIFGDVIDLKNIQVKQLPSESESSHSTEVKDSRGNTVYRQSSHRSSKKRK